MSQKEERMVGLPSKKAAGTRGSTEAGDKLSYRKAERKDIKTAQKELISSAGHNPKLMMSCQTQAKVSVKT